MLLSWSNNENLICFIEDVWSFDQLLIYRYSFGLMKQNISYCQINDLLNYFGTNIFNFFPSSISVRCLQCFDI